MKKIHGVILLLGIIILLPSIARAEATLLAQLTLRDVHITSSTETKYSVALTLHNGGDIQTNIRYGIQLVPIINGNADYSVISDEKIADGSLSINTNKDLTRTIQYNVPSSLNGAYKMLVVVKNKSGLPLASSFVTDITIHNQVALSINPLSCYLTVEGEKSAMKYNLEQGVDIGASENLQLNCQVTNASTHTITAGTAMATYLRTQFGDLIRTPQIPSTLTFKANETKNVTVSIPKPIEAQAYTTVVDLIDVSNGTISNTVSAHWVLRGVSGTIQNVSLDKNSYASGDTAVVSFAWSGKADSFDGSRAGTLSILPNLNAHIVLCGQAVDYALKGSNGNEKVEVPLTMGCVNPQVIVSLMSDSNVLDTQDASVATTNLETVKKPESVSSFLETLNTGTMVAVIVMFLLVFLVAILAIRSKNSRNLMLLVVAGSTLFFANVLHAQTTGNHQSILQATSAYTDENGTKYLCNFKNFPKVNINSSTGAGSSLLRPGTVLSLSLGQGPNTTCKYRDEASNAAPVTESAVITADITVINGAGEKIGSLSRPLGTLSPSATITIPGFVETDTFSIYADYSLSLASGKKLNAIREKIASGTMNPYTAVGITLSSGGGTIQVSTSATAKTYAATISLNAIAFDPGQPVKVTATAPVVIACTNGATNSLYINYDVFALGNSKAIYSEAKTHAVVNHVLVNTPAKPLTPGSYYLVAKYYDPSVNLFHNTIIKDELEAIVIIPFIVNGAGGNGTSTTTLTAPMITQANGMCSPTKQPEAAISWRSVAAANSYSVERSLDGTVFSSLASSLSSSTLNYKDTTVPVSSAEYSQYTYRVSALDAANHASSTKFAIIFKNCDTTSSTTIPGIPTISGAPLCQFNISSRTVPGATSPATISEITWSSLNTDTCTGTNFDTHTATSGVESVYITSNTTFGLLCKNNTSSQTCLSSSTVTFTGATGAGIGMGSCVPPQNAALCINSDASVAASTSSATLRTTQTLCSSTATTPTLCEFYCPLGFQKNGAKCVLNGTVQEQ